MTRRNQDVLDMIEQVRARLVDLEDAVLACGGDLPGFADRLDRIDDRVYLLETEAAKRAASDADEDGGESPRAAAPAGEEADEDEDGDEEINILTPEAKAKIGETVGDMRAIGREAAETFSELNEAFSDITGPFKSLTGRGRRR